MRNFEAAIVTVPWFKARQLLRNFEASISAVPCLKEPDIFLSSANIPFGLDSLDKMPSAGITAVHLWFDRAITDLPHAALVGRLSQWIFNGTAQGYESAKKQQEGVARNDDFYYQVVISAAHRVVKQIKGELLQAVLDDLKAIFPNASRAKFLHARVITMPKAVFSMQPGVDFLRPTQRTSVPNLFLAGDWTATGWPGTMEGAVRSGNLAAEKFLYKYK